MSLTIYIYNVDTSEHTVTAYHTSCITSLVYSEPLLYRYTCYNDTLAITTVCFETKYDVIFENPANGGTTRSGSWSFCHIWAYAENTFELYLSANIKLKKDGKDWSKKTLFVPL